MNNLLDKNRKNISHLFIKKLKISIHILISIKLGYIFIGLFWLTWYDTLLNTFDACVLHISDICILSGCYIICSDNAWKDSFSQCGAFQNMVPLTHQ